MPRGRPIVTGTAAAGSRQVRLSAATVAFLNAHRRPEESLAAAVQRIVAAYMAAHPLPTLEKP